MNRSAENLSTETSTADLRGMLHEDHEHLDKLFADLVAAFQADAREDAARLWNDFDAGLRKHLLLEEQSILPEFGKFNPAEAAALLGEHERIRQQLLELGVGVDLHLTRDYQVAEFVRALRAHAAREDAVMYQWAQRELRDEPTRWRIVRWLKMAPTAR